MTTLNFALSRTAARELRAPATRSSSPASTTTATSRPGSSSRTTSASSSASPTSTTTATSTSTTSSAQLSDRTRVVAFPLASNAVGTLTDVRRIVELAHGAGALAWADAVHYAPHVPDRRRRARASTSCSARRTSSTGRTSGVAFVAARARSSAGARTRCGPAPESARATASRRARRRTSCSPASSPPSSTSSRSGGRRSRRTSGRSASASSPACPTRCTLYGPPTMDGRVPTFAFTRRGPRAARGRASALGERGIAVRHGDYYALEVLRRLGLAGRARSAPASSTTTPPTRSTACSPSLDELV